jgi:hypothetical protein
MPPLAYWVLVYIRPLGGPGSYLVSYVGAVFCRSRALMPLEHRFVPLGSSPEAQYGPHPCIYAARIALSRASNVSRQSSHLLK